MRRPLIVLLLVVAAASASAGIPRQGSNWIALFNGRDLDGWTPKITRYDAGVNFGNTFRVEHGILRVVYDQYGDQFNGRYGHLFYNDTFAFYRLRVEYRFVGTQAPGGPGWALRNSGVMLHGESPATMTRDQEFPVSIEVQFLGGDGTRPRPTSNVCTPGTHVVIDGTLVTRHCTNSTSKTHHGDAWVTAEVEVCGSASIRHYLDGDLVLAYSQPQYDDSDAHATALAAAAGSKPLSRGTISLQSESHPVEFRKLELLPLSEATCRASR